MIENPYQPSSEPAQLVAIGVNSGGRDEFRKVALYQRRILTYVLLHLIFVGLTSATRYAQSHELFAVAIVGLLVTWFAGVGYVFLLAFKLYDKVAAVLLGLLSATPIFGLIVLLIVHNKANSILKRNGIEIGFLGARPSLI